MTVRTRRVGTLTMGVSLIAAGILFLVHLVVPADLSYYFIFKLWPVTLILLGAEVLAANLINKEGKMIYDGWAIFIMIIILCIAGAMAGCQILLDYGITHGYLSF